jgi:hypothetical protein
MDSKDKRAEKGKARLPAPTLFVAPQSVNASRSSLNLERPASTTRPVERTKTNLTQQVRLETSNPPKRSESFSSSHGISSPLSTSTLRRPGDQKQQEQKQRRSEALWVEMQSTLDEVELNAGSTGSHVFGAAHSKALDELRTAQIALAQAWARSETEDDKTAADTNLASQTAAKGGHSTVAADVLGDAGNAPDKKQPERAGSPESVTSHLEEETENDIALANKRREANDQYFRIVNSAVNDVVAKLDEVAQAMKGVEQETKEIWGDKDSIDESV